MKNIYVSDLDGTLLNKDSNLSDFSREGINKLYENDVVLLFASARGSGSMKTVLNGVKHKYPMIECNGAYITSHEHEEHIGINEIPTDLVRKCLEVFDAFDLSPMVSSNINGSDRINYTKYSNEAMANFFEIKLSEKDKRITKLENMKDVYKQKVVTMNLIEKHDVLVSINQKLKEHCQGISAVIVDDHLRLGWHWIMINSESATKGTGIKVLLNHLTINQYHLTVFGDNSNDESMFAIADYSVATANGSKRLKEMADQVIDSCDTDAVIRFILEKEGLV